MSGKRHNRKGSSIKVETPCYSLIRNEDKDYYRVGNCLIFREVGYGWAVMTICLRPGTEYAPSFEEAYALAIYLNEQVIVAE